MRSLSAFIVFVLLVACVQSAEAKYLHCYKEEAPETAQPGPGKLQQKLQFLEYSLVVTIYRKACALTDQTDRQYVRSLYEQAGCTAGSDVGRSFDRVIESDITEIEGFARFREQVSEHPVFYAEFCELVRDTPWPIYRPDLTPLSPEIYSAYQDSMRAIRAHRERFIEERNSDKK